jgi:D-alanyl-D-alanine carboxypeptidase (penicillin-binding protein 5/6)
VSEAQVVVDGRQVGSCGHGLLVLLVRFYSGATGLKTGFTANAGYCLSASAQRDGMELIAVVMGSETSKDRFAACKQLLDYGFANYALVTPEVGQGQVPAKLGSSASIKAVPVEDPQLLIDKSQRGSVTTEMALEESVTAPVSKGQRLGTMTVRVGEQVLRQIPMVAADPVQKLTWGQLFAKVMRQISMAK